LFLHENEVELQNLIWRADVAFEFYECSPASFEKGGRGAGPQWPLEVFALTVRALIKGQGGDGARWGRFGK